LINSNSTNQKSGTKQINAIKLKGT
jgi:hypothetical protein